MYSEQIEADLIALPPEVDDLTDEEVTNDDDLDVPVVLDVAGQLEIDLPSDDDDDDIPLSSYATRAPSTSHQLNINDEDPDVPVGERMEISLPSDDDSDDNVPLSNFVKHVPAMSHQQMSSHLLDNRKIESAQKRRKEYCCSIPKTGTWSTSTKRETTELTFNIESEHF